jgi:hypothetical protein
VALDGLHKVWPRHSWRIRPAKVKVKFGKAFYAREVVIPDPSSLASSDANYEAVIAHLRQNIDDMITEMRRR